MNSYIRSVQDYIVKISGNDKYGINQIFRFKNDKFGIVVNAKSDHAFLIFDGSTSDLAVGDLVKLEEKNFVVETKTNFFGTIIDIYGKKIFGKTIIKEKVIPSTSSVFKEALNLNYRQNLNQQLYTGTFAIDVLFPIGYGQRQAILGDAQTGKTSLCLKMIINNKNNHNLKIIYVSIGNKRLDIARIYHILQEHQALNNTIILHAASDNALQQYLLPYVAMNHAENLMAAGFDVLVLVDNLTSHSNIIREIGLLTNTPVGKEAFPGNLFYAHAQFLERAGKFSNGKSISCIPVVKTINNDITSLLASNIISITDGQIVLNSEIRNSGILPAIDLRLSVSRLGGAVQSQMLSKISSQMNRVYSLYLANLKFSQINFDFNPYIKKILNQGKLMINILNQAEFSCYSQVSCLILGTIIANNLLEPDANIQYYINMLQEYMKHDYIGNIIDQTIAKQIEKHRSIDDRLLESCLKNLFKQFDLLKKSEDQLSFNDPDVFKISPNAMKILKGLLWVK
ncbi:F0F1 ATP synthase, F1 complex subunit alpha [[Mycoplasma] cavipharyngis]|uniref:ATP F0F1 synthase subunit alpha n=1 Tax=[Mycoplasma] cavipharyngis TaxID=92757 RepID=UPI00370382ED